MPYVIAVDDDPNVLDTLRRTLELDNIDVTLVNDPTQLMSHLETRMPDLLILDIMMPEIDGITICRRLRRDTRYTSIPILFLTAKGSVDDVVRGLDAGADDYIVKPFNRAELTARLGALLRRASRGQDNESVIELDGLRLDSNTHEMTLGEHVVQLTATEHRLMRYLMQNPNQALSPMHLLEAVWEYPPNTGDPDLVRAHVRNLRAKIQKQGGDKFIRTVHGVGYMVSVS